MRHFQANTVKDKPVLSIFFLGRRVLKNKRLKLSRSEIHMAKQRLPELVYDASTTV